MKVIAPADRYFSDGTAVKAGEEIEVDDTVGESLLEQGWQEAKPKSKAKSEPATSGEEG